MKDWKERIQDVLDDAVEHGELAGGSLLILQDGEEKLYATCGYADIDQKKPYERDTIVRLYSMSKPFTGAATMILLERGLIDLNDPVEWYLPDFANPRVFANPAPGIIPAKREVRLRDLVSMTAGVSYPGTDDAGYQAAAPLFQEIDRRLYTEDAMTTNEIANAIGRLPLAFQPGEHFRYSTCADVMAAVIEVVSGMKYGEFLKKEIIDPLGLKDTGFWVPAEKQYRLAKAYLWNEETKQYEEEVTNHLGMRYLREVPPAFESGGAGMVGTLQDYARFGQMLLNGGELDGVRILQPQTIRYMTGGQLNDSQMQDLWKWSSDRLEGYNYSFFNRVSKMPNREMGNGSLGEYGWDGWMGTYYANDPANNITMVLMTQRPGSGNTRTVRRVRNIMYSVLTKETGELK